MPLHSTTLGFSFDTTVAFRTAADANATSSCLQDGQEQVSLCEPLLILGALVPVFIWPILPSRSEVVSYRLLGFSASRLLVACSVRLDNIMPELGGWDKGGQQSVACA
jgi:hypothetical protein